MANEHPEIDAFIRQIEDLDIELSQRADGVLTVCSTAEPFFCFDADTREELGELVSDTLASYAKFFFNIEGLAIKTQETPIDKAPLPVERSEPVFRLKPIFDLAA